MPDSQPNLPDLEEKFRFVIGWTFVIVVLLLGVVGLGWWLIADWNAPYLIQKIDSEFNVLIGIPASAAARLEVCFLLESRFSNPRVNEYTPNN